MEAFNDRVNTYIDSWMGPRGKICSPLYNLSFLLPWQSFSLCCVPVCQNISGLANGAKFNFIFIGKTMLVYTDDLNNASCSQASASNGRLLANFDKSNDYFILKLLVVSCKLAFQTENNNDNTTNSTTQFLETV